MSTSLSKIFKWFFLVWGGVTFAATVALVLFVVYRVALGNRRNTDSTPTQDVRFVLNWCQLGDERIEHVVHSYESDHSFTGDYLDAYAIQISHVETAELASERGENSGPWYRGDQLPLVLEDAVEFVGLWRHEVTWFPTVAELRSQDFYVYPWSVSLHGVTPTAVRLIFIRPSDRMVFYFGCKT